MTGSHDNVHFPVPWWVTQLVHVLAVAPYLVYVGVRRPESSVFYWILGATGAFLLLYFSAKLFWASDVRGWLVIHAYAFSLLFLYMAWKQKDATDIGFSLLIAVGSAAAGYHVIRMMT